MEENNQDIKFCPNCGKKRENNENFCSNCGHSFIASNSTKPNFDNLQTNNNLSNESNLVKTFNDFANKLKKYYKILKFIPIGIVSLFTILLFIFSIVPLGSVLTENGFLDANLFQTFNVDKLGPVSIVLFIFIIIALFVNVGLWIVFFKKELNRKPIEIGNITITLKDFLFILYAFNVFIIFILNCVTISLFQGDNYDSGLIEVLSSPTLTIVFYILFLIVGVIAEFLVSKIESLLFGSILVNKEVISLEKKLIRNDKALGDIVLPLNKKEMKLVSYNLKTIKLFIALGVLSIILFLVALILFLGRGTTSTILLIILVAPIFLMMFSHIYFIRTRVLAVFGTILAIISILFSLILLLLFIIDHYKFVNNAYYASMIAAGVMVFLTSCFAILTFVICYFKMKKNNIAVNSYNIVFKEIKETHSKSELKKIIKSLHKFIFKNDVANFNKLLKKYHDEYCNK